MIDINKKLDKIEKNCYETAKKEYINLKEENDNIISEKVTEKINSYKDELAKKYIKEINKIEREYNREVFDYEMDERVKINEFKQSLKKEIKNEVEKEILNFINTNEYKEFLIKEIDNALSKLKNSENIEIYITEKDFYKYGNDIKSIFNINLEKMENEKIGGCILEDLANHISIDNTLKTDIEEKVEKINL